MQLVNSDMTLDQIREFFANDRFATGNGCVVVEASTGHAVCEMEITPNHLNGMGSVMGGAIFTVADFALAVGCNMDQNATVSVSNTIEFLSSAKGTKLIATCSTDRAGRSLGYYTVDVEDDTGRKVAKMTATCYRA